MAPDKEIKKLNEKVIREFKLTTVSLKNRTSIFLLTFVIALFGLYAYRNMPKELFPDIALPWIMVQTVYPGNPPIDMENLVTRPIEKEIEPIKGIKNITSTSTQDISFILVEFNPDVDVKNAEDEVKKAVDYASSELPNDLPSDPVVSDIDFSEFPILNINLSGDYSTTELKKYAEILEERIETVSEISKVDITGISDREIQINVDLHKLEAFQMSFDDVANAVALENMSISGGELKMEGTRRSIRTIGEFDNIDQIKDIIVKRDQGNIVYLRDLAEVVDGYEDATSYTRLNGQPVVSLQVVKKGGENLLSATKKIENILSEVEKENIFPDDLSITITNDQSDMVKKQLNSLENSMIISMIFVISILFLFLGTRNALFVGLAIPLSMFLSFIILDLINFQVNMIVLFSLILALGMLVDNAIVVVENIYRFVDQGYSKLQAAKQAVGEIAVPIIVSTATTLAAFLPLAFWKDIVGEFMKFLPITLIIVLTSSLFVALVIVPVFSSSFIKKEIKGSKINRKKYLRISLVIVILAALLYVVKFYVLANLLTIALLIILLNMFVFNALGNWFKDVFLVKLEEVYHKILAFALKGLNPAWFLTGTFLLLVITIIFFVVRSPNVLFFSDNDPDYMNILAELPVGTNIDETENFSRRFEKDINAILKPYDDIIESKLVNVGEGAVLENDMDFFANRDNKCLMTVSFVDFQERKGINTSKIMKKLTDSLSNKYAGVEVTFEKNSMGPPTGKAINIEVSGKDYEKLISVADTMMQIIEAAKIPGIESLQMDLDLGMPEMIVTINRDKARRLEMSTAQIASTIRTALFGREISDFKIGEEEYPIQLRSMDKFKNDVSALMNQKIVFMNNQGKWLSIPISAVADFNYSSTYGAVKRKDLDRVITLYSNVIEGYNANNINEQIKTELKNYDMPSGYNYKFTGEQEDMQESMEFLSRAFMIALALIMLILVTQFNSIVRPFIIIASVVFSTIGVFGGIATFKMDFIVIMTGVGIVSLAGVVVNNAIVLVDYIELLKLRKRRELGMSDDAFLPLKEATQCIIQGGRTRLRPVLLTAITTILGLLPMAIGLNIDFESLLSNFDPKIYIGGVMTGIWGPISWTVIFGLSFATFLTLIIVPVMYRITTLVQKKAIVIIGNHKNRINNNSGKH
jgi:multidrug efflux pump subunit AcrB